MAFAVRELSAAHLGPRVRMFLARRPWLRWLCIGVLAVLAGSLVHGRMRAIDAAREQWAEVVEVPVAVAPAAPGEVVAWRWRELPMVAVPDDVAVVVADSTEARRHIGVGEIIVAADLDVGPGPAGGAEPGEAVVPINDPLVTRAEVGLAVAVYSDGLVLAPSARIVHVEADIAFVAVDETEAPMIAAAAQTRQASLGFLSEP